MKLKEDGCYLPSPRLSLAKPRICDQLKWNWISGSASTILGRPLGTTSLLWWNGTLLIPSLGPMWHLCEEQTVRIGILVGVEEVHFGEGFVSWRRCLDGEDLPRDL